MKTEDMTPGSILTFLFVCGFCGRVFLCVLFVCLGFLIAFISHFIKNLSSFRIRNIKYS